MNQIFSKIILLGRPASGKSEIINFLKNTPVNERISEYHIGKLMEIDDFPMLWTWFEEDHIIENIFKKERIHSTSDGYFKDNYMWNLLIERISLDYKKAKRDESGNLNDITFLIEFSRGSEHGGYKSAFKHLSNELLEDACLFYVDVPYEESLRKNRKRFNPDKPDSILEHGLPDSKLEKLYKEVDFHGLYSKNNDTININGFEIPLVIFNNMPSKTDDFSILAPELKNELDKLWNIYQAKKGS